MRALPKVHLAGAAGLVTGSCTLVESPNGRLAIDLGLIQGTPEAEADNISLPIDRPDWLDAVVLTHAHADHCGRLPMLARTGFEGPILTTPATAAILPHVLHASARLQQRLASEARQRGHAPPPILFETDDVDRILQRVRAVPFKTPTQVNGTTVTLHPAGHILGAASVLTETREGRVLCSGDLGHVLGEPLPPPEAPPPADLVVMECTRGDTLDDIEPSPTEQLARVIEDARIDGQVIVCPTFALGRAHQLLFRLGELSREGRLGMPVMLDSMISSITAPLHARFSDTLSVTASRLAKDGVDPLDFPELRKLRNRRAARVIKDLRGPALVMAGNGFGEGGPIVEHLIRWLPSRHGRILLAGYCMPGTVTGRLAEDPPHIKLRGRPVRVEAPMDRLSCFSGHADAAGLMAWVQSMPGPRPQVVLHHGDPVPRATFAEQLRDRGYLVATPARGESPAW